MRTPRLNFCLCLLALVFTFSFARAATVTTLPATAFSAGSVTFNASAVLSGGSTYFCYFDYGTNTSYGHSTGQQVFGSSGNANFNQPMTGLLSNQVYHFRAGVIVLNVGTFTGNDLTFTIPGPPVVATVAATFIHPGQAILNATINPNNTNGATTSYWFQHGLTTNYGSFTSTNLLAAGINAVAVSNLITGLPRGVAYHFRAVASNVFGQSFGTDISFNVPAGLTNASGSTGGGQSFDARQPALELNFLICTNGIYPSTGGGVVAVPFLSEIRLFAGNFAPANWAFCWGQSLLSSNYLGLYSLMGATFGGSGFNGTTLTNFNLPDLRGNRVLDTGQTPGLSSWSYGQSSYNLNFTVSAAQETLSAQYLPSHTHSLPLPDSVTGAAGGASARYNWQPALALNYGLVAEGIYPIQGNATIFEPFLGQVIIDAMQLTPFSLYPLDGSAQGVNQNTALFNVIGTNYGGTGVTTFFLPNLRSRIPMGVGQGPTSAWVLGQQTGLEYAYITGAQMPAHQHAVPSLGIVTGITGSNQPISLMQPVMALQYLICTNGQIPSPTIGATNQMLGEIQMYAGTNLPGGWLPCDGRLLQVANARSLFGVISNWYGGDGVTTFAIPNMAGRVAVDSTNGQPGASYGAEQTVLTLANLPPHTHAVPALDFDRWITSFGLSNSAAAFAADADADKTGNGYEWATGSNPTNKQSLSPLTIQSSSGKAKITFPRNTNATDVIFTLQRSTNLTTGVWTGIATNQGGVWLSSASVTETGTTNPVSATVSDSATNTSKANYRLQITWP